MVAQRHPLKVMLCGNGLGRIVAGGWAVLLLAAPGWASGQEKGPGPDVPRPAGTGGAPRLDWDKPVVCLQDEQGRRLRLQCNTEAEGGPICLVAPDERSDGGPLQRVQPCRPQGPEGLQLLHDSMNKLMQAVAEAPPGWHRDEQGRVFQITFDLMKRFWLGAGWEPAGTEDTEEIEPQRIRFDMGFVASWLNSRGRTRHTLRLVEGQVALADLHATGLLFSYDSSHASARPVMRITTFFGDPERHDIYMDTGMGLRLLQVETRPHRVEDAVDIEYGELHTAWNIFQSSDLASHLRLQLGVGLGSLWSDGGTGDEDDVYLGPNALLEARGTADDDGFHNLRFVLQASVPLWLSGDERPKTSRRLGASFGYELIVLAINDQPLSLLLSAQADHRDDLGPDVEPWEFSATAGLRLSFWAPARITEAVETTVRE